MGISNPAALFQEDKGDCVVAVGTQCTVLCEYLREQKPDLYYALLNTVPCKFLITRLKQCPGVD